MSPAQEIRNVAANNSISVRTLLAILGLLLTPIIITVGGIIQLNVRLVGIESNVRELGGSIMSTMDARKIVFDHRLDALEKQPDRWTDRNMDTLQKLNERALNGAGVKVELPDAFDVKAGVAR